MVQVVQFLKEVRIELNKVEWPSRSEFIGSVIVTSIMILFFSFFVGLVDRLIKWIIYDHLFNRLKK